MLDNDNLDKSSYPTETISKIHWMWHPVSGERYIADRRDVPSRGDWCAFRSIKNIYTLLESNGTDYLDKTIFRPARVFACQDGVNRIEAGYQKEISEGDWFLTKTSNPQVEYCNGTNIWDGAVRWIIEELPDEDKVETEIIFPSRVDVAVGILNQWLETEDEVILVNSDADELRDVVKELTERFNNEQSCENLYEDMNQIKGKLREFSGYGVKRRSAKMFREIVADMDEVLKQFSPPEPGPPKVYEVPFDVSPNF